MDRIRFQVQLNQLMLIHLHIIKDNRPKRMILTIFEFLHMQNRNFYVPFVRLPTFHTDTVNATSIFRDMEFTSNLVALCIGSDWFWKTKMKSCGIPPIGTLIVFRKLNVLRVYNPRWSRCCTHYEFDLKQWTPERWILGVSSVMAFDIHHNFYHVFCWVHYWEEKDCFDHWYYRSGWFLSCWVAVV